MKEISEILAITQKLRENPKHQGREFTLDGKLVGDIGEVLAAEKYGLQLLPANNHIHDAFEISTGRKVQIKSSFKNYCYFPYGHIPDYFLSINIFPNGDIVELFNGPGQFLVDHYISAHNLKPYKNTFYTLSKGRLLKLNELVPYDEKLTLITI